MLITNLLDMQRYPAPTFRDLNHQRWRLKHRMAPEHLSGLSQLAARQDFGAKILSDNLHALCCLSAAQEHEIDSDRRINRTFAITAPKPVLSAALLGLRRAKAALKETLRVAQGGAHSRNRFWLGRIARSSVRGCLATENELAQVPCQL
ncbi:hypothetical protein AB4Z48_36905 [Cupriavidus sp. 2TAF22]|uniref:hypothetical protein n=1 Tax=unclassified Cupriavidus TaxID=2640874 RepID=UPI003F9194C2